MSFIPFFVQFIPKFMRFVGIFGFRRFFFVFFPEKKLYLGHAKKRPGDTPCPRANHGVTMTITIPDHAARCLYEALHAHFGALPANTQPAPLSLDAPKMDASERKKQLNAVNHRLQYARKNLAQAVMDNRLADVDKLKRRIEEEEKNLLLLREEKKGEKEKNLLDEEKKGENSPFSRLGGGGGGEFINLKLTPNLSPLGLKEEELSPEDTLTYESSINNETGEFSEIDEILREEKGEKGEKGEISSEEKREKSPHSRAEIDSEYLSTFVGHWEGAGAPLGGEIVVGRALSILLRHGDLVPLEDMLRAIEYDRTHRWPTLSRLPMAVNWLRAGVFKDILRALDAEAETAQKRAQRAQEIAEAEAREAERRIQHAQAHPETETNEEFWRRIRSRTRPTPPAAPKQTPVFDAETARARRDRPDSVTADDTDWDYYNDLADRCCNAGMPAEKFDRFNRGVTLGEMRRGVANAKSWLAGHGA
jgi:hypothetical protein